VQSDLNAFKKLGAKASVSGWESKLKAAESAQSSAIATLNADLATKSGSAVAACNTDVKTVEIGVQAYYAHNSAFPSSIADLTTGANAALRSWPSNNSYYYVGLATAAGTVSFINVTGATSTVTVAGAALGQVYVDAGNPVPAPATAANWQNYNSYVVAGGGNICSLA
jgi:hypothetical protein